MVKSVDKKRLSLRPVNKEDFSTIEAWLNKDYIKKWYGEPDEWMLEIRNDSGNFDWLNHYIVLYKDVPIGFCQYYDCSKTPEGFEWDSEPQGTFGIDYLIGQEAFLKKGIGSVIVKQLCRLVCTLETPVQIIADPVPENTDSIKLLRKNGFILDPITGFYKMKIEYSPNCFQPK